MQMKNIDENMKNVDIQQNISAGSTETPSDKKMKKAYELASSLIRDRLETEDKENIDILDEMTYLVLQHSKIPFKRVDQTQLSQIELRSDQTVFVNCTGTFDSDLARKLNTFVNSGGQLITTDWCLRSVLEPGFPGYVEYNNSATSDEVVRIEIVDKDDPVLKGFLDEETDPQWWLEGSSYPIKVLNKNKVSILIKSKQI
ncbi:MAG: hypothetical protein ACW967_10715, partial [Candidatus Hodarchaeales archaeon]